MFGWLLLFRSGGKPGFGPAAELLFFASPKKSNQKKGEPRPCRFAVPCATRSVRGRAKLASLKQRPPLSERCSVAQHGLMAGDTSRLVRFANFARGACSLRSHRGVPGCLIPHASLLARARHAVPLHLAPLIPTTSLLIPHPSKTAAVPQLRHSARSRGIHVPLHSNLDAATTRSMTACAGHRCPHHPHHSPSFLTPPSSLLPPPSSLLPPQPSLLTPPSSRLTPHSSPFKDSGSTPTSSFRAQSRNPCPPALQLGCCDYAQHDGVCRAPLPPSPTPFPVFPPSSLLPPPSSLLPPQPSLLTPPSSRLTPHSSPFKDSGSTPTSSFRAQSRNPCFPALQLGCCDYAQHDGMCRAPLPPSPTPFPVFPPSSLLPPPSSPLTPHSSPLTPHSSLLTPHSSLLTPHPAGAGTFTHRMPTFPFTLKELTHDTQTFQIHSRRCGRLYGHCAHGLRGQQQWR